MSALFIFLRVVVIICSHDREKISLEKSLGNRLGGHGGDFLHHEHDHDLPGNPEQPGVGGG